jgi:hypothetical protein
MKIDNGPVFDGRRQTRSQILCNSAAQIAEASCTIQESTASNVHLAPWANTSEDSDSEGTKWEDVSSEDACSESDEELEWQDATKRMAVHAPCMDDGYQPELKHRCLNP